MKIFLLHNGQRIAKKRKTNVKKRTLNPEFNETFVFDLPYSQEELKNVELDFIVFDWDRLSKNEVTYMLYLCRYINKRVFISKKTYQQKANLIPKLQSIFLKFFSQCR